MIGNLKEGNYFRTKKGLIGRIDKVIKFRDCEFIEYLQVKKGDIRWSFHIEPDDIEISSNKLIKLLKVGDLATIEYPPTGTSTSFILQNEFAISKLKDNLEEYNNILVGILSKEYIQKNIYNINEKTFCTIDEQEHCQTEKMGCKGCFYNID